MTDTPHIHSTAERSRLLGRLTSLRTTIRRRLVLYGVCAVAAGGVASFLSIVALDWLFWLPPALRLLGGLCFLAGFVASTYRWIIKPLSAEVGLDEIAHRVERHFGSLEDRLASAVSFLGSEEAAESPLAQRVIEETEVAVGDYRLESVLSRAPLVRQAAWFAVSAAVLVGLLIGAGGWMRIGFYRYVYPTGEIEWPRAVSIVPLTRDQAVAIGESVTVRMEINRGLTDSLRGEVHLLEPDGRESTQAMQRDRQGTFYATIDAVTEDLKYWFVAGDDSTARSPYTIRVVRRPEIMEILATVEPPSYAQDRPPRVLDLADGEIAATLGAVVNIDVTASKPLAADGNGRGPLLVFDEGEPLPLTADEKDATRVHGRFKANETTEFQVRLRDKYGMENRGATRYVVRAVPDAPPVVTVAEPQSLVEMTPTGSVRLDVRVSDDFGVSMLQLFRERNDEPMPPVSLKSQMVVTPSEGGVTASAAYDWSMQESGAAPGDVYTYTLSARDNYQAADANGQEGRSSPQRIRVISLAEFGVRLRADLANVEARIRQVALEQAEAADRTHAIMDDDATADQPRRLRVSDEGSTQANLMRRTRELARRVSDLVDRIGHNDSRDEETKGRVEQVVRALDATATGPMSQAASALADASQEQPTEQNAKRLAVAAQSQEEAVDQLHSLLQSMAQWGQFQGLVAKTRGLLERQDALRTETAELGRQTLGKKAGDLAPEEAAQLKRAERKQDQLTDDVAQLLQRMEKMQEQEAQQDPVSAEALARAIRAAHANDMARHLDAAADALKENRTAAASIAQKNAADAMRKMLRALQDREERELAELRKALRELADQLTAIIDSQQDLRKATHEATLIEVDAKALAELEQEQRRLRRNSQALADEIANDIEHVAIARLIRQGVRSMNLAEAALTDKKPAAALPTQDEALDHLREALDRLQQQANEVDDELRRRTLAQIQEQLTAIREAQTPVDDGVKELHDFAAAHGQLGRLQNRTASRLMRTQIAVREQVDQVLPDLEQVVVFRFAMNRVATDMDQVRDALQRREIDDDLVKRSADILAQLDLLIQAAIDTADLPIEDQFVESEGGGGGQGKKQEMGGKPVPTLTELLVLKAIQVDINRRTKAFDERVDLERPTESDLHSLQQLGRDQKEALRLTDLLTKQARQHP